MKRILFLLCAFVVCVEAFAAKEYTLLSPNGKLEVTIATAPKLAYSVKCNGEQVLAPSHIGLNICEGAKLIEAVHIAEKAATGSVVFINKGKRHVLDLSHSVRLVDTEEYGMSSYEEFFGFVCGILSQNYDIAHIFIDSITKIVNDDMAAFEACVKAIEQVAPNVNIVMTASIAVEDCPAGIKAYA